MKFKIITMICLLVSQYSSANGTASDQFTICDNCSSVSMRSAAAGQASNTPKTVHVISKPNRVVRSYHVEILSEPEIGLYRIFTFPLATDTGILNFITDTLDNVAAISNALSSGTPVGSLPGLGSGAPGSALDLPGSSQNINAVRLALQRYLSSLNSSVDVPWYMSSSAALQTLVSNLTDDLVGTNATINFPDGSSYEFKITDIALDAITHEVTFHAAPVTGSGTDGEGHAIPESVSDLNNLNINVGNGSGNNGNVGGWIGLIGRIGHVSLGSSNLGLPTNLTCTAIGNTLTCTSTLLSGE